MNLLKSSILVIIFTFSFSVFAQTVKNDDIKLEGKVTEICYCEKIKAQIYIKLSLINQGKENLIIYKNGFSTYKQTLAENDSNIDGNIVGKGQAMLGYFDYLGNYSDEVDTNYFYILKPKEKIEISNYPNLKFIAKDWLENNGLKDGKYFLNLNVRTIPLVSSITNNLQQKWKNQGRILSEYLTFPPIEIVINTKDNAIQENCPEYERPTSKIVKVD